MEAMLDRLYTSGKANFLRDLKNGLFTLPWLYSKDLAGELETLVNSTTIRPLSEIIPWVNANSELASTTKRTYKVVLKQALQGHDGATIAQMPAVLTEYRNRCLAEGKTRSFNLARSVFQSYATSVQGQYDPIWIGVTNVAPLEYQRDCGKKLTFEDAMQLTDRLVRLHKDGAHHAMMMWSLLLTGMRSAEYQGNWIVYTDRVLLTTPGKSKQSGQSSRIIPRVDDFVFHYRPDRPDEDAFRWRYSGPYDPLRRFKMFRTHLTKASDGKFSPHDLRHTFRQWCLLAGVPEVRAESYMGHRVNHADMKKLYTTHDVEPYLRHDAGLLLDFLEKEFETYWRRRAVGSDEFEDTEDQTAAEIVRRRTVTNRVVRPS